MIPAVDVASDFAELERACARLREIAAMPAEVADHRRLEVSGWSALEHVSHVALANELIVRNMHSLVAGEGLLVQHSGEPSSGALEVLASGMIPRGQSQSPRMVRPPARIDRALLAEWLASGEVGFAKFAREPELLRRAKARVPHQLLGPLTAAQWVRFAWIHTRHHLAIVELVLGA